MQALILSIWSDCFRRRRSTTPVPWSMRS